MTLLPNLLHRTPFFSHQDRDFDVSVGRLTWPMRYVHWVKALSFLEKMPPFSSGNWRPTRFQTFFVGLSLFFRRTSTSRPSTCRRGYGTTYWKLVHVRAVSGKSSFQPWPQTLTRLILVLIIIHHIIVFKIISEQESVYAWVYRFIDRVGLRVQWLESHI